MDTISAPIAQWIEHQPAELGIQIRFLLGAGQFKASFPTRTRFFYLFFTELLFC